MKEEVLSMPMMKSNSTPLVLKNAKEPIGSKKKKKKKKKAETDKSTVTTEQMHKFSHRLASLLVDEAVIPSHLSRSRTGKAYMVKQYDRRNKIRAAMMTKVTAGMSDSEKAAFMAKYNKASWAGKTAMLQRAMRRAGMGAHPIRDTAKGLGLTGR